MSKPRVIKDYDKLTAEIHEQLKITYPRGFDKKLILFKNHKNKYVSALPFEGEEYHYLIKMTKDQAIKIAKKDDDFDENGRVKLDVLSSLNQKYGVVEEKKEKK